MHKDNYPEDSTLRRHAESAAAFQREEMRAAPPSDSVLFRHYQQMQQANAAAPTPSPASSQPAPASAAAPAAKQGGFFGWLKRLFG